MRKGGDRLKKGKQMKIIEDKELYLDDDTDLLETKKYADVLKEAILNIHTPSTIGLFGEWGSGKSSIIKTVQNDLEKEKPNIKFITYDAWKYQGDSFRRTFLKEVANELRHDGGEHFKRFYESETSDILITQSLSKKYLFICIGLIVALCIVLGFLPIPNTVQITLSVVIALVGSIVAFSKNLLVDYKTSVSRPVLFASEQFSEIFNEMIGKSLKKTTIFSSAIEYFCGNMHLKNLEKIVIIVDNLDRCDAKTACEMLGDIKGFLEKKGVVFVVPIDDSALLKHIQIQLHSYNDTHEVSEFLRKIFNVALRIKNYQTRDLFLFTKELLGGNRIELKADTIGIIAREYASNPRRIIQFINNFQMEKMIVQSKQQDEENFVEKYETLIAFFLILREEWRDFYQEVVQVPAYLLTQEGEKYSNNIRLQTFLKQTIAIWEHVDTKTIEKIIFNLDNESTLSSELRAKIENLELSSEDITEQNCSEIVEYLIEELRKEVEYKTFKTRALSLFRVFIENFKSSVCKLLNNAQQKNIFIKLQPILQNSYFDLLDSFDKEERRLFFEFVECNREVGLLYLAQAYKKDFYQNWKGVARDIKDGNDISNWDENFINFINEVKLEKETDMTIPFLGFSEEKNMEPYLRLYEVIEPEKAKNFIITNEVKERLLNEDEKRLENLGDTRAKILCKLGENGSLDSEKSILYTKQLLDKISRMSIESIEKAKQMLAILEANNDLEEENCNFLNGDFYNFMCIFVRNIQQENLEVVLRILCRVFEISNYQSYLNSLLATCISNNSLEVRASIFCALLKVIKEKELSLLAYQNTLLGCNDNESGLLGLYEIMFGQMLEQDDSQNSMVKTKINEKISLFLIEHTEVIKDFLINLSQNNQMKIIVADLIKQHLHNVDKFPHEVQKLVFDDMCQGEFLIERNNYELIKNLLLYGDNFHQNKVVNFLTYRMHQEAELPNVLSTIEDFDKWTSKNKKVILDELKNVQNTSSEQERILSCIKKLEGNKTKHKD